MDIVTHQINIGISIHSLRMEGDHCAEPNNTSAIPFQSTPSAWRETLVSAEIRTAEFVISIHSLRMEGDELRL